MQSSLYLSLSTEKATASVCPRKRDIGQFRFHSRTIYLNLVYGCRPNESTPLFTTALLRCPAKMLALFVQFFLSKFSRSNKAARKHSANRTKNMHSSLIVKDCPAAAAASDASRRTGEPSERSSKMYFCKCFLRAPLFTALETCLMHFNLYLHTKQSQANNSSFYAFQTSATLFFR